MLAEIFMARLEAALRMSQETLPSNASQFVPFNKNDQFALKDRTNRLVEPTPQEAQRVKRGF